MKGIPRVSIVASDKEGNGLQGDFSTLSVGLGLHRAWTYLALFCSTSIFVSPAFASSQAYSFHISFFYFICVIVTVITLLCIAALNTRVRKLLHTQATLSLAAVLCTLGSLIMVVGQFNGELAFAASIASGMICGISNATLIVFWGMAFARFEVMTIVINTAISIALALILFAILSFYIPNPWNAILTAALPLLELPFARQHLYSDKTRLTELPKPNFLPTNKKSLALRLSIPLLLFGYALGILRYFTVHAVNVQNDITMFFLAVFSACIVMVIILVILYYYAEKQSGESLSRYMAPIIICGMLFLAVPALSGMSLTAPFLMICYLCFKAMIWIFLCGTCSKFRLSPLFVVSLGFGSMALGSLLSNLSLVANDALVLITPFGEYTILAIAIIAMVIAYALLPRTADIARAASAAMQAPTTKNAGEAQSKRMTGAPSSQEPSAMRHDVMSTPLPSITAETTYQVEEPRTFDASCNEAEPSSVDAPQIDTAPQEEASLDQDKIDAFRAKCDEISNKYLLSRRERDVLYLLARGHNASYIQEKLYVAQSTTKTHIYHIYKKLEIHSQQELIAMVMDALDE